MRLLKINIESNNLFTQKIRTMKKLIFCSLLSLLSFVAFSQVHVVAPHGNTGIGTETPSEKLEVKGDTKTEGAIIEKQNGSASVSCEKVGRAAFSFGAGTHGGFTVDKSYHLEFRSNTRDRVLGRYITEGNLLLRFKKITGYAGFGGITNPTTSIHTSGSITYNGALYNTSDERLKRNISDMEYGLKEVLQLNPITFQYNGKGGVRNVDAKQFGLKAQNLQKVAPELVTTFTHQEENDKTEVIKSEEYLMIEESAIKYMLVNAVKEQQAIIETQTERIGELESALEEIKSMISNKNGSTIQTIQLNESNIELPYLGQNSPNPVDSKTNISYFLPESTNAATLQISNQRGQLLREISIKNTGQNSIDIDMNNLTPGIYFYSLIVDGNIVDSKKMISN